MRFFDDPGKALQQMEDELLEEDWEEDEEDMDEDGEDFPVLTRRDSRPTNYAVDSDRTVYDDEETDDAYYAEDYIADRKSRKKQRKKGSGGLVLLLLGGMPLFDSLCTAFGTAGTGGFGIINDSCASYTPIQQWIITLFMIAFGVNFGFYYLFLITRFKEAFAMEEVRAYLGIILASGLAIAWQIRDRFETVEEALRASFFQVGSIMTTTGYSSVDFDLWPSFSKCILVLLMIVGACAGSTGGGVKVSRVVLTCKSIFLELGQVLHPHGVQRMRMDGKTVDSKMLNSIYIFLTTYFLIFFLSVLAVSLDGFNFETNFTAVAATLNNIGPGLAGVGPTRNFYAYSHLSKLILIFDMLAGRLELLPMLILFYPRTWTKN